MPEVNYKTSELFQLLDMGLRDNMLTNPDSSMHSLAKTIHATTLETDNPLFNKLYKNKFYYQYNLLNRCRYYWRNRGHETLIARVTSVITSPHLSSSPVSLLFS